MIAAREFVPVGDVTTIAPESMDEFIKYFEVTYVIGTITQGRRQAFPWRFHPSVKNHYASTLTNHRRAHNSSEGWHTKFRLIIVKNHPDIFSAIKEIKKEQGDTEI